MRFWYLSNLDSFSFYSLVDSFSASYVDSYVKAEKKAPKHGVPCDNKLLNFLKLKNV